MTDQLIRTAALANTYLDGQSRKAVLRFVKSKWNRAGGVCGRDQRSDLYYTVFGALCLKALRGRIPALRLFLFLRGFGAGEGLDAVHRFCLIRLRSFFPMSGRLKREFAASMEKLNAGSAYDSFVWVLAADCSGQAAQLAAPFEINAADPTTNLAAAVVVNGRPDAEAEEILMARYCPAGGFCIGEDIEVPDLLSTATALFALNTLGFDLDEIREPCFTFIESLWRDSGGFAGHAADRFEDVEYTFYALLSIGCLMSEA